MQDDDLLVDTPDALQSLCERLMGSSWLTVDTEFMREKTYYSRLCLVQVASEKEVACIDPLSIDDLSIFFELLHNRKILKVFHSATQDMEILMQESGQLPGPIFDTQVAAALLGQGDQIGYAALVKELLDIELDKSQTRTNWARRPLSTAQLKYAADDVRFLREVFLQQKSRLEEEGRLDWLREDCEKLEQEQKYQLLPEALLKRVKGQYRLPQAQRAIVQELAILREALAQKKNLPRKWILPDQAVLDIAQSDPNSIEDIQHISTLSQGQFKSYGEDILRQVVGARKRSSQTIPPYEGRLPPEQVRRVSDIQQKLRVYATNNDIHSGLLASRREIEQWVRAGEEVPLLSGWRYKLVGI
jgi:ribonuclease D